MLKLTWAELNAKPFIAAIMTLNSNSKLDNVTAYRVGRIVEVARKELSKAHAIEIAKATTLADKDEKGEIIYVDVPGGKRPQTSGENDKKLEAEMAEVFESHFAEVKVNKLDFNALNGLTGEQLIAISSICDNLPE